MKIASFLTEEQTGDVQSANLSSTVQETCGLPQDVFKFFARALRMRHLQRAKGGFVTAEKLVLLRH